VLDTDPLVRAVVTSNAEVLGLDLRLRALDHDGRSAWPVAAESVDAVVCVSVFEAMMRRRRLAFFAECRRVLKPQGELLLTFDFGDGARLVGDPPCSSDDLMAQIVRPCGLSLAGPLPAAPTFSGDFQPPVRLAVLDVDGFDYTTAAYTFGALRLVSRGAADAGAPAAVLPELHAAPRCAAAGVKDLYAEILHDLAANGGLRDLPPAVIGVETWDELTADRWYWDLTGGGARQVEGPGRVDCVLSGTAEALKRLSCQPDEFWPLYYAGVFGPRGDMSIALRLLDRFPHAHEPAQ
jgi:SAM-dependent methyltransferase